MTNLSREETVWLTVYQTASKKMFWTDALLEADETLKSFRIRFGASPLPQKEPVSELSQAYRRILMALNYCNSHIDQMWAATVVACLLDCDFRESKQKLKEFSGLSE